MKKAFEIKIIHSSAKHFIPHVKGKPYPNSERLERELFKAWMHVGDRNSYSRKLRHNGEKKVRVEQKKKLYIQ